MRCWGYNANRQLGGALPWFSQAGTPSVRYLLGGGRTVKQMAHTESIRHPHNDTLKCWGYNLWGELGLGHRNNMGDGVDEMGDFLPAINFGTNATVKEIVRSISYDNNCAVVEKDGMKQVYCWGRAFYGEDGTMARGVIGLRPSDMGSSLVAVNLGSLNTQNKTLSRGYLGHCVTGTAGSGSGTAKCWGYNETSYRLLGSNSSELAIGDTYGEVGSGIPSVTGAPSGIIQLEGVDQSPQTCAIFDNGKLRCWGYGAYGVLGQGNSSNYTYLGTTPDIDLGTGRTATQFSIGYYTVCARLDNGSVKCWGYNANGQLGQGHLIYLGDGANEMGDNLTPIDLGTGVTAKYVCTNNAHACAVMSGANDGKLKCWGYNGNGQLGYGDTVQRGDGPGEMGDALPFVDLGTGRTVKKLSCGVNYNCAILDNDKLKCWGYNGYGHLGISSTAQKGSVAGTMGDMLPYTDVGTGRTVVDIKASYYHTCALLDTNEVKCWGYNAYGQRTRTAQAQSAISK